MSLFTDLRFLVPGFGFLGVYKEKCRAGLSTAGVAHAQSETTFHITTYIHMYV